MWLKPGAGWRAIGKTVVPRCDVDRGVQTDCPCLKAAPNVLECMKATLAQLYVEGTIDAEEILRLIAREEFGQSNKEEAEQLQRTASVWVRTTVV